MKEGRKEIGRGMTESKIVVYRLTRKMCDNCNDIRVESRDCIKFKSVLGLGRRALEGCAKNYVLSTLSHPI